MQRIVIRRRRLLRAGGADLRGASAVEYALLIALIAAVIVAAVIVLGLSVIDLLTVDLSP